MSIEVLNPAPDEMLTTATAVIRALRLPEDTDCDEIEGLIRAASAWIENYCGRTFGLQRVKERLVGTGLPNMLLTLTPLVEVEKVTFDDIEITSDSWEIYDKDVGTLQRQIGWLSTNLPFGAHSFNPHPSPYATKRWAVVYSAGYILPGWVITGEDRNLPYDLERACISVLQSIRLNAKIDGGWTSYKIGETQVVWGKRSDAGDDPFALGLPQSAIGILNFYRRGY